MDEKLSDPIIIVSASSEFIPKAITYDHKLKNKVPSVVVYANKSFGAAHVYRQSSTAKDQLSLERYRFVTGGWKMVIKDTGKYDSAPKLTGASYKYQILGVDLFSNCILTRAQISILKKLINIL